MIKFWAKCWLLIPNVTITITYIRNSCVIFKTFSSNIFQTEFQKPLVLFPVFALLSFAQPWQKSGVVVPGNTLWKSMKAHLGPFESPRVVTWFWQEVEESLWLAFWSNDFQSSVPYFIHLRVSLSASYCLRLNHFYFCTDGWKVRLWQILCHRL